MKTATTMTGAELQTLREAAGLTRAALAELATVEARTVKHWETRAGLAVPADVAELVRKAAQWVRVRSAHELGQVLAQLRPGMAGTFTNILSQIILPRWTEEDAQVALVRYREAGDMLAEDRGATHAVALHGAMVARLLLDLLAHGVRARVVWFDPPAFEAWRTDAQGHRRADTHNTRQQWAAQAMNGIPLAARPFPGKMTCQPPGDHINGNT